MKPLDRAHDIRKFEIGLYWRRATYFWTLIGAAFVAFFVVQAADDLCPQKKQALSIVVANLGLVFSVGWYLANRGSKFWQENWETQVDRLEQQEEAEPLYRYFVQRTDKDCVSIGPEAYSVSKINESTSLYVAVVWAGLLGWLFAQGSDHGSINFTFWIPILLTVTTAVFCLCLWRGGKSDLKDTYYYCMKKRTAKPCCLPSGGHCTQTKEP